MPALCSGLSLRSSPEHSASPAIYLVQQAATDGPELTATSGPRLLAKPTRPFRPRCHAFPRPGSCLLLQSFADEHQDVRVGGYIYLGEGLYRFGQFLIRQAGRIFQCARIWLLLGGLVELSGAQFFWSLRILRNARQLIVMNLPQCPAIR